MKRRRSSSQSDTQKKEAKMQNLASAFPHLAFSQTQSEKSSESQLPPELQFLLSASLDQGLYANQLAALKNATPTTSAPAATVNGIPADFASLLLSSLTQQQQQQQPQQQQSQSQTNSTDLQQQQQSQQPQQPQIPTTPSTTAAAAAVAAVQQQAQQQQQNDEFAQLMALIAGPQQPSVSSAAAATNSFLEQMNFFTSPSFNLANSQHQSNNNNNNSSNIVPTTPTSSGSNGSHFFGGLNASMNSPNKDSYCEFCDKNFCNRYFLRIHKQKKHGIRSESSGNSDSNVPDTPPAKQPRMEQSVSPMKQPSTGMNNNNNNEEESSAAAIPKQKESINEMPNNIEAMLAAFQEAQNSKAAAASQPDLLSLFQQIAKVKSPEPQATIEKYSCDKCSHEFTSQTLLLQHQLTQHTVIPSSSPPTSSTSSQQPNLLNMIPAGFSSLPFMMPQLPSSFPTLEMEQAFGNHPSLNQSLSSKPSAPKRQYSSTTKNYCDLCNKEVCNKYFLRTHMLKMHNIIIDVDKPVIANIDTYEKEKEGSVSFRCDLCHTDMKTRTQLKDHKKSVHGINPVLVAPSSAGLSRAGSSKPSSAIGSGASQNGESSAFEFPPTSTSPLIDFKCTRCEIDFDGFQSLVAHLHAEHTNEISEEEFLELLAKGSNAAAAAFQQQQQQQSQSQDTVTNADEKMMVVSGDENDEAMEITREVAMKMAVENQMMKGNDENEMESDAIVAPAAAEIFTCSKCGRNYSTEQNLNDHVSTVHQYKVRLSPKKDAKSILSPSKVNKIIKCFTCVKCNQRFASSHLCKLHIIEHLRREQKLAAESNVENENGESSSSGGVADEHKENKETTTGDFEDDLIISFMREESSARDKSGSIIEQVASELSRRGSHGGLAKLPEEKHSHTSGSASPMSVHTMPEGYAQPHPAASSSPKPFVLQSFVMREVSDSNAFPTELHAYLPVRNLIDGPIRVTFELQAAPQIDAQIKNL